MEPSTLPNRASAGQDIGPDLWLVRHGESTWNVAGLAQGQLDQAELTDRGLRQASDAAWEFRDRRVRAIYSSDLRRARQTAAAFAAVLGLPVLADDRLRERSLGAFEGLPSAALGPAVTGLAAGRVTDQDARPVGGESVRAMYRRAAAFCDELAAACGDSIDLDSADLDSAEGGSALPGLPASPAVRVVPALPAAGDVIVVAHGGTVRVLTAYLHGIPPDRMAWGPVDNATVVHIPDFRARLPWSPSGDPQSHLS